MNKALMGWIIAISLFSCQDKNNTSEDKNIFMNTPSKSINELQSEVFAGNIESYHDLRTAYLDSSPEEFLFWAMLMANKNDYPQAYLDVYYSIVDAYIGGEVSRFGEIDDKTQNFLLDYLKVASKKGIKEADEILAKLPKK